MTEIPLINKKLILHRTGSDFSKKSMYAWLFTANCKIVCSESNTQNIDKKKLKPIAYQNLLPRGVYFNTPILSKRVIANKMIFETRLSQMANLKSNPNHFPINQAWKISQSATN